jgi:vitamin B12 transporter
MTYFSSDYKNLIDFDSARGYINIFKASSRGAEIFFLAKPNNRFHLRASYVHNEARDKVTNQHLLRRPKRKLTIRVYYDFSRKAHLTLSLLYTGKREDIEWSGWISQRVVMPSYTLLNASLVYDMIDETQIFLKLENLLDEEYEVIKGYGTAGFSLYGGLKVLF